MILLNHSLYLSHLAIQFNSAYSLPSQVSVLNKPRIEISHHLHPMMETFREKVESVFPTESSFDVSNLGKSVRKEESVIESTNSENKKVQSNKTTLETKGNPNLKVRKVVVQKK